MTKSLQNIFSMELGTVKWLTAALIKYIKMYI